MKVIIEDYAYPVEVVRNILWEGAFQTVDGRVSIGYVGYYFNSREKVNDCVFILPKVLLEAGEDGQDLVFGKYKPEDIVDLGTASPLGESEQTFISTFSVWIYRALCVYRKTHPESTIVYQRQIALMGKGHKRKSSTLLGIILSLIQFQKDNRDFFLFTVKNLHAGFNKINWGRTIATTRAFVDRGCPIYLRPINRRKVVNFDEELLVIFYSILNYIHREYGFAAPIDMGYELITGRQFKRYLRGYGKVRLNAIRGKYFSDVALHLWTICRAFFDYAKSVDITAGHQEYLLAKNFNIVFEAVIDDLIGDKDVPAGLKEQEDGKQVDHIYRDKSLITAEVDKDVYYIGDSKYYKYKHDIGRMSVAKQFTYARNVIQWNLNLFLDNPKRKGKKGTPEDGKLRDDVTEGYNVIPNFFISARMMSDEHGRFSYADNISEANEKAKPHISRQFENRLFDRDTLLIAHYDVNFLFIISLYARANPSEQVRWKDEVRRMFRDKIRALLNKEFEFYAMIPRANVDAAQFLREDFQLSLGKVYSPYSSAGGRSYYSLALDRDERFKRENEAVREHLKQGFIIGECPLGVDPSIQVKDEGSAYPGTVSKRLLTHHWIENYLEQYFLVGCYKDESHFNWMFSRKGDNRCGLYNVRADTRAGAVSAKSKLTQSPKFLVLYNIKDPSSYSVYRINDKEMCSKGKLEKTGYPNAHGDSYYVYSLEEEVTLGNLDVPRLLLDREHEEGAAFHAGAPFYRKGAELIGYRI